MSPSTGRTLARVARAVEDGVLVVLVIALLAVGLTQLVLRNVFHTGVLWFEPLSRYLVLWIAFAGANAAAGEDRHIRIDLVPRMVAGRAGLFAGALTSLASAVICAILARAAMRFLGAERQFGAVAFLAVPTGVVLAAIPLGFALLSVRLLGKAVGTLVRAVRSS